ncbi:NACHT domain-containing protein [Bacteroidota bacterium]
MKAKIEKIQNLSEEELLKCMLNLLTRMGYSDSIIERNRIVATLKKPLGEEEDLFLIFDSKLGGQHDSKEIFANVEKTITEQKANSYFIVSKFTISSAFKEKISSEFINHSFNFIGRDELIQLIENKYRDFWRHDDIHLIEYEKLYCESLAKDSEIRKLKIFEDKYQKLLDIFIEPTIYHTYKDNTTQVPVRKKIRLDDLVNEKSNCIVSGDAGTGKTTLLKKVGQRIIDVNLKSDIKYIPVFLSTTDIYNSEYKIFELIKTKLQTSFKIEDELFKHYKIVLLVDSIDEFDDSVQKAILEELSILAKEKNIKYLLASRNHEKILNLLSVNIVKTFRLYKFNDVQVRRFAELFFSNEGSKAEKLIEALKENRIIDRLPLTPLTLSLISILYEENNLEIPSTIADIYDNFNSLIIGRATVTSRIEFIDISFKERILSLYALYLLECRNCKPLSKDKFKEYFDQYFKAKTLPIKKGTLEEVLDYLIEHTGILVIKEDKWVKFSHDSYLEYYAALEIFKHQRDKEELLIENFLEHNWQNAAIFYAGKSKDLPKFLEKILSKLNQTLKLNESFMGIMGAGYVLQALYQTDNVLRKKIVLRALNLSIGTLEIMTKLAADETFVFRDMQIPILQLMNLIYFLENFSSATLKDPLLLAFDEIFNEFKKKHSTNDAHKLIKLAFTLDTNRIAHPESLERVVYEKDIFSNPTIYLLCDIGFAFFDEKRYREFKKELGKNYLKKIKDPVKSVLKLPANKLRFSNLDVTGDDKKIKIITEGKTDAEIIEHAYYCLTDETIPYWQIRPAGNESGGATEVAKALMSANAIVEEDEFLIGIFDHDAKGLQEFRGLKKNIFETRDDDQLRKHSSKNIFALCLPVPGEMDHYLQSDQEYNLFELEHYFDREILLENNMIEEKPFNKNIYGIKDKRKKEFSSNIRKIKNPQVFSRFIELFLVIDKINGCQIEYLSE